MNPAARFSLRHALHAMNARFVFQLRIDFVAFNQEDRLFQSADARFRSSKNFKFPSLLFGVARIHAHHLGREQGCLIAARAGTDLENDVLFVVWIAGNKEEFELAIGLFDLGLQCFELETRHLAHLFVITRVEQFARVGQLRFQALPRLILLHHFAEHAVLFRCLRVGRRIRQQLGRRQLLSQLFVPANDLFEFV